MTTEFSFHLNINNIIPHADKQASENIIAIWKEAEQLTQDMEYSCLNPRGGADNTLKVMLSLADTIQHLENAVNTSGSFNAYRQQFVDKDQGKMSASIGFVIRTPDPKNTIGDAYKIASILQQQLYLAMNITYPGTCQWLGVSFDGPDSHLYEAQSFDSKVFYDARMASHEQSWPTLQQLDLKATWHWINRQRFSGSDTAISDNNRILMNLLKLAQQRHGYGSRSALLASHQLELLLNIKAQEGLNRLRDRTALVLGQIPEAADCFIELFHLRDDMFQGNHPIRRPALISHSSHDESREQMASHNTTIELAAGMVVCLIQALVKTNRDKFQFREVLQ
jgi:hypothetical protein